MPVRYVFMLACKHGQESKSPEAPKAAPCPIAPTSPPTPPPTWRARQHRRILRDRGIRFARRRPHRRCPAPLPGPADCTCAVRALDRRASGERAVFAMNERNGEVIGDSGHGQFSAVSSRSTKRPHTRSMAIEAASSVRRPCALRHAWCSSTCEWRRRVYYGAAATPTGPSGARMLGFRWNEASAGWRGPARNARRRRLLRPRRLTIKGELRLLLRGWYAPPSARSGRRPAGPRKLDLNRRMWAARPAAYCRVGHDRHPLGGRHGRPEPVPKRTDTVEKGRR